MKPLIDAKLSIKIVMNRLNVSVNLIAITKLNHPKKIMSGSKYSTLNEGPSIIIEQ
jgi:hypothetical protein